MILAGPECEPGLQEQITSGELAAVDRRRGRVFDRRLVIMSALICGAEVAKTVISSQFREALRPFRFSGRAVEGPGALARLRPFESRRYPLKYLGIDDLRTRQFCLRNLPRGDSDRWSAEALPRVGGLTGDRGERRYYHHVRYHHVR